MLHMYAYGLGRTVAEVPDVEVKKTTIEAFYISPDVPDESKNADVSVYDVFCWDEACGDKGYIGFSIEEDGAEDIKYNHIKWHEEGMEP